MKKFLSVLALLLVVAGCSNAPAENENTPNENQPAAITTLDTVTFADELENTEIVKVYVNDSADTSKTLVEAYLDADSADLKTVVVDTLKSLTLEESSDQEKVYGTPYFMIDLNSALDSNYVRFAVFEDTVVIQTKESYVNYTLDDASAETINTLTSSIVQAFASEEE